MSGRVQSRQSRRHDSQNGPGRGAAADRGLGERQREETGSWWLKCKGRIGIISWGEELKKFGGWVRKIWMPAWTLEQVLGC